MKKFYIFFVGYAFFVILNLFQLLFFLEQIPKNVLNCLGKMDCFVEPTALLAMTKPYFSPTVIASEAKQSTNSAMREKNCIEGIR
jgi:hypothetical protein